MPKRADSRAAGDIGARLRAVRGYVIDLDGTLVLGDRQAKRLNPLPGAIEFLRRLEELDIPFMILTNGTLHRPESIAANLRTAGFVLPDGVVETPTSVAVDYFLRRRYRQIMVFGEDGVWGPCQQAGLDVVPPRGDPLVDAVFVGWHPGFTMAELEAACNAVGRGAALFAASLAPHFMGAQGPILGVSRAICAVITSFTGRRPVPLGKPSLESLRYAARRMGVGIEQLAVVGDDPALEAAMALRGGALAIGVNGTYGEDHNRFAALAAKDRPHLLINDMTDLLTVLDSRARSREVEKAIGTG